MTEERITEVETPEGNTHTHTTVISDGSHSGGGGTLLVVVLILVALMAGFWAFTKYGGAEMNKDNAVAAAADKVGNAAGQVGEAAGQAGQAAQDAADSATN